MNSSWRSQPLRDPQQITYIMLNRIWSLSKKPFTLLLLTDNIKLDGMPSLNLKCKPVLQCISNFKKVLLWEIMKYNNKYFYFLLCIIFYISRYHFFNNFLEFHSTLSEKDFCRKFSFFNRFIQPPLTHPP